MTRFFMGYIFFPLAMYFGRRYSQNSHPKSKLSELNEFFIVTAAPIMTTFVLAVIWHGAGLTFIVFGVWHAGGLITHRLWEKINYDLPIIFSYLFTVLFVAIGFIFFKSDNLASTSKRDRFI